ncbi:MAG: methylmalonyl-CoA mutase family protein, partial [Acidimicrobiales bacterium]
RFQQIVASVSFFVNSGIRFVEEVCKMRAFTRLWEQLLTDRYGISDPRAKRFRYGVQVNSLGLTEAQPENNVQRIVLEMLGVTLSADARARSLQLPAWNEALGLPRPWDQQWSLRMQQVLAHETDLLEYDDIFNGSHVIEAETNELIDAAMAEFEDVQELGGAFQAIGELKARLVHSHAARIRRIESGDQTVVGLNTFTESAESPLGQGQNILVVDPAVEEEMIANVEAWRAERDHDAVAAAIEALTNAASGNDNIMPATIQLARVGGTTGDWAQCLREVFGEYRAPTGVGASAGTPSSATIRAVAERIKLDPLGPPRLLVGKPGLDGHSNGAEQIAIAARDAGMEVIYQGIRLTPTQIAIAARDEDVDAIGLSILSGSHRQLVPATVDAIRAQGIDAPIVVGGILPPEDHALLQASGVAAVFTPKDYDIGAIIEQLYDLIQQDRE